MKNTGWFIALAIALVALFWSATTKVDAAPPRGNQYLTPSKVFQTCSLHGNIARALWHEYKWMNKLLRAGEVQIEPTLAEWKKVLHEYVDSFYTNKEKGAAMAAHKLVDMLFSPEFFETTIVGNVQAPPHIVGELVFRSCINDLSKEPKQDEIRI